MISSTLPEVALIVSDAAEPGRDIDPEVAVADLARQRAPEGDGLDLLGGLRPEGRSSPTIATIAAPATAPTSLLPIRMLPPDNRL